MPSSLPSTAPAWQYTSLPHTLESALHLNPTAPLPPHHNKVLVSVRAAALNPADYKLAELPLVARLRRLPATPGLDFAGVVAESAHGFTAGDRVFGRLSPMAQHGTMAMYVAALPAGMARLPDSVSFEQGACLGTAALVAYQVLIPNLGQGEGKTVFVNGASGGVGSFCVQMAKLRGARVVASCSGAKAEMVKGLGADEVIDYRATDLLAELKRQGRVLDLVVDNVGEPLGLHKALDVCVKDGGSMVQIGSAVSLAATWQMMKSALWPAILGGPRTPWKFTGTKGEQTEDFHQIAEWAGEGKIKPVIDSVYSFKDVPKAIEKLKTGRATGKIVVNMEDQ